MSSLKVDVSKIVGRMKIMHSVNNVPVGNALRGAYGMSTYKYFKEAGIPYCRSHDAALCEGYCGEFAVDVHRIFRDFNADENDPASYDFEYTDRYVQAAEAVGAKVFYRLGASIEHHKKVGTYFDDNDDAPPKNLEVMLSGLREGEKTVEYYLLDEKHDSELVKIKKLKETNLLQLFLLRCIRRGL